MVCATIIRHSRPSRSSLLQHIRSRRPKLICIPGNLDPRSVLLRLHFSEAALSRQDIEHIHAFVPLQNMNEVVLKEESTSLDHFEFDIDAEVSEVVITLSDNMRLVANHKSHACMA